ncbi:uncharacterized protein I303_105284 [Kwoniella dejecticola CBS 10117]|uniref:Uncharacterized protein n=1 Tax=Kwoniella dejecticola CBS 10117 TaxID=1296121 RepID=A0A1A6A2Y3_9TREE|nr:uncharacterized protein I303_05268 [Kwoniella dejecticola CBS 10117]OBR84410.1 hypothetical protein I303_05268 [Kwoniella dejecticola CBS 10117]
MRFTATAATTVALLGAAVAQQTSGDITVNSPASLVQCQPAALSWSGGSAPYIIAVIPGGQPSAAALETISQSEQGNSLTWTVDIAANTEITIKLTDSKGAIQYSSPVTIQSGSDSCLNGASSSGSSGNSTSAASTSAASGAASGSSGSSAASASGAATSAGSAATRTTATATASTSTVTGSGSASGASGSSAASGGASGASGSSAPSSSASATGADSGALPNGMVAVPAVVFAVLGAIVALF